MLLDEKNPRLRFGIGSNRARRRIFSNTDDLKNISLDENYNLETREAFKYRNSMECWTLLSSSNNFEQNAALFQSFPWIFRVFPDEKGRENPFKPGGDLSNEAESLIECWKKGRGWIFSQSGAKQDVNSEVKCIWEIWTRVKAFKSEYSTYITVCLDMTCSCQDNYTN